MNLQPLVLRELRVAVRRPGSYRIRMAAGAGAICISVWAMLVWNGWTSGASLGSLILHTLATAGFVGVLLGGVVLAADCLSQEARECTLGLILLTGLKPHELVFGKLAAKIVIPIYALIGMVPGFAACSVIGGVTGGEFWRLLLVLVNTLFFALCVALLTSSLCETQRTAYSSALLAIIGSAAGVPYLGASLAAWSGNSAWADCASLVSPTGSHALAFAPRYAAAPVWFWSSIICTHLLSWLSVSLACGFVARRSQTETESSDAKARTPPPPVGMIQATNPRHRADLSQAANPIAWLAGWRRAQPLLIWTLPLAAACVWTFCDLNPLGNTQSRSGFFLWIALHLLFKIWLAAEAAHAFASDRRSGALELLLGTPLLIHEIADGMLQAFRRRFLGAALTLCALNLLLALRLFLAGEFSAFWIVGGAALFLFDCHCVCWVGLWRGLVSLHPAIGTMGTAWRILILPWILTGLVASLFPRSSSMELAGVWAVLNAASNLVFLGAAKKFLHEHFRVMALRPYGAKPPHVETEWSAINWEPEASQLASELPAPASR